MIIIDLDEIKEALEYVISTVPVDFVYNPPTCTCRYCQDGASTGARCLYVNDNKPSCLIGQALTYCGVPLPALADMDSIMESHISSPKVQQILSNHGYALSDSALGLLTIVQTKQDDRAPWSQCL